MIFLANEFDIEQKNFENLCYIHRTSLLRIIKGVNVYKVLDQKERNRLLNTGILISIRQKITVSDRAVKVISSIK